MSLTHTLEVEHLVKRYGQTEAVRDISFTAQPGEILGLLGPNGAGKTSTIECIVGLRRPDEGRILIGGIDAQLDSGRVKQTFGVALQATQLQDKITPTEALKLFGSFYDSPASPRALIDRFALTEKADAPFQSLSGGQRQRLALALAFVSNPQVLFLDEPTSGLDPQARRELHASILRMREEGRTVVLTTHYIEEAETLCDRVAIIDQGKIVAIGSPAELIARSSALAVISVKTSRNLDRTMLEKLPRAQQIETTGQSTTIKSSNATATMIELLRMLEQSGTEPIDLQLRRPSLEDVFIELTGSSLRD